MTELTTDTLFARWQYPMYYDSTTPLYLGGWAMRALPKPSTDQSQDFFTGFPTFDSINNLWLIYRGGPDFGSHRLAVDSFAFGFHTPDYYNSAFAGYDFGFAFDCGDMTGAGNRVMVFQAYVPLGVQQKNIFYVFGDSIDDQIDMEFDVSFDTLAQATGWSGFDKLSADGDGLEDIAMGYSAYISYKDFLAGKTNVGSVQIVHSSKNIPVHEPGTRRPERSAPDINRSTSLLAIFQAVRTSSRYRQPATFRRSIWWLQSRISFSLCLVAYLLA